MCAVIGNIYTTEHPIEYASACCVPDFSFEEVRRAVRSMKKKKCPDKEGVVLEMFLYGGDHVLEQLKKHLNSILVTGNVPFSWYETHFSMLHKGGTESDANNWRPIAILSISYKILAKIVFNRIHKRLDDH